MIDYERERIRKTLFLLEQQKTEATDFLTHNDARQRAFGIYLILTHIGETIMASRAFAIYSTTIKDQTNVPTD